jgi:hypothetical protein
MGSRSACTGLSGPWLLLLLLLLMLLLLML